MAFTTGDNNFGTAKWIVDATAGQGTHTTIAAALTAASSGQTIFIRPGTYTENLTLKAGVNLVAYTADAVTPNVTISGKCTFTLAGTVTLSGIRLQTNSDYLLEITGANASIVNLYDCYLNCTNHTGINLSAAAGVINLVDSEGDVGTTGIALFTAPGGGMDITNCNFSNSGGTSTASNWSGTGSAGAFYSTFGIPLSTSGSTFSFTFCYCFFQVPLTHNCTAAAAPTILKCFVSGGTNPAISIGAGASLNVYNCEIQSSNTNAITGAGTLSCSLLDFIGSSSTINATLSTTFIPLKVNQGGTGDSSVTAYAPICGGTTTTGALQSASTGLGTSGFVFTSNGSSTLPSFQAPASSGNLVLISSQTASTSSSLVFTLNASYVSYLLIYRDVTFTTGSDTLIIQVSTNGGSTYLNTNYVSGINSLSWNSNAVTNINTTSGILIASQFSGLGHVGSFYFSQVEESSSPNLTGSFSGGNTMAFVAGCHNVTETVNAFKIVTGAASTFSGTFTLFAYVE